MVLHPFRGARDDGQLAVLESVSASGLQHQVSYADSRDFQDSLHTISGLLLNQKGPAPSATEKSPISCGTNWSPETTSTSWA
jgi:hypothetical protein